MDVILELQETPNERSHLIPASTDSTPTSLPNAFVVDHQKLKERMGHIVRSKEGKMVNVNSRLPFNLHNKKLSVTIEPSSSSRSASSSTNNRPSLNFSPLSSTPHTHAQVQAHVGAPLTSVQHPDVSRSSSVASRETSTHDSDKSIRSPILNVRLVRGLPSGHSGAASARRGRAKRKGGDSSTNGSVVPSPVEQQPVQETPVEEGPGSLDSTVDDGTPRVQTIQPSGILPNPTLSISPASTVAFKLQDTGPLTVSWGD
ncbi:hypothetical protein BDZ97DRAFT_1918190 [Flammula alnicola]|nr:hypothetical protein BDZ97DRAFT_1918190 [Flammula alnicola]